MKISFNHEESSYTLEGERLYRSYKGDEIVYHIWNLGDLIPSDTNATPLKLLLTSRYLLLPRFGNFAYGYFYFINDDYELRWLGWKEAKKIDLTNIECLSKYRSIIEILD